MTPAPTPAPRVLAPRVLAPLGVERRALASALPGLLVVRTGMGRDRATAYARQVQTEAEAQARAGDVAALGPALVAGVGGGLGAGLRPGDVVVATEVRHVDGREPVRVPAAPLLVGALRRAGLRVRSGPVVTSDAPVDGVERARLAATGALAVDMESAHLVPATAGGALAVLRVVVDTAEHPLRSVGTAVRGAQALRVLRRAAPAVAEWAAATAGREVLLASPRSFCAGVDRAIETVERALERSGGPVYVRRQIVHNAHVVAGLEQRGAVFVQEVEEVPTGADLVLAAHGVAPEVRLRARERGLSVVDATCPLVTKVHAEVRRYAGRGDTVFLIGHSDHEEVVGTVGEAPGQVVVVEDAEHAARVQPVDPERVAYVMQTTLAVHEAEQVAGVLRERFPSLSAPRRDDICYATTNRQQAVRAIAAEADLVLVVGSANSSNSRRLVDVAERAGSPAHLVEDVSDVDLRWLAGAGTVGVTAGASAPPHLVTELVHALSGLGPLTEREVHVVDEDIRFTLPREVS